MDHALIIGGTRFIGRHLVETLLAADYEVTLFNRGKHPNPFERHPSVDLVTGDRANTSAIAEAAEDRDTDAVFDMVAYYPAEVEATTRSLAAADIDLGAYVYVSSGAVYASDVIPKREGETSLEPCSDEQATSDTPETYGARKAEGDRVVFEAAKAGLPAMSVRPTVVYGTHDYTGRFEYWVQRVRNHERILIPGDGTNIQHLVAAENVARALKTVAEGGTPGEAYNVGDREVLTLGSVVRTIADILDRDVELVTSSARELSRGSLDLPAFPLYNPSPHLLSTAKLSQLGWEPLTPRRTYEHAIEGPVEPERDPGPDRDQENLVLEGL